MRCLREYHQKQTPWVAVLVLLAPVLAPAMDCYKDPTRPVRDRVEDLLSRMTIEEKVAQLGGWWDHDEVKARAAGEIFKPEFYARIAPRGLGEFGTLNLSIEEDIRHYQVLQDYFLNRTRLGIPVLRHGECAHGFMRFGATSFPAPIALACTWNPALVEAVYDHIGRETASRGVQHVLSPVVDVARELRWGRIDETLGEDPWLVSRLGAAMVRGLQGGADGTIAPMHVAATLKHFAGFASPEGGLNNSPYPYGVRRLLDVDLYPFRHIIAVARPASVMAAYNTLEGIPCHANRWLLTDVLRGMLGFKGLVVADYNGVARVFDTARIVPDDAAAGLMAITAGLQLELPNRAAYQHLPRLLAEGRVGDSVIDDAVRAVLELKFRVGAFENRPLDVAAARALPVSPEAARLALASACESIVLLKNADGLLPLDPGKPQRIAVIGPNAGACRLGSYSGTPERTVSLLDGIRTRLGGDTSRVASAQGCLIAHNDAGDSYTNWRLVGKAQLATLADNEPLIQEAVRTAKEADVVVLALGECELLARETWWITHLGDRTTLDLTESQQALARAVLETGKPVILYLVHGRPITLGSLGDRFKTVVAGHYAGQATGTAAARILFGDEAPSGKLAMSWPRSVGHQPACYSRDADAGKWPYLDSPADALFPFGHGLTYTTFSYTNLSLSSDILAPGGTVEVRFELVNTGVRRGTEIVQLYVSGDYFGIVRPGLELKGFDRVTLEPGEKRVITLPLAADELRFHDAAKARVLPAGGQFRVSVGGSSAARTKPVVLRVGG